MIFYKINKIYTSLLISISICGLSFCFADSSNLNEYYSIDNRQTKSYLKEELSAKDYHDAALRGELAGDTTDKDQFLLSSLKLVKEKPSGVSRGGIYQDLEDIWFVKKGQFAINEYLGSKIMNLLIGPFSPEVKLFIDAHEYTASKSIPGFVMQYTLDDADHKPIAGKLELDLAMDLMGLGDRHSGNMGYIENQDSLVAARVDFDHSFYNIPGIPNEWEVMINKINNDNNIDENNNIKGTHHTSLVANNTNHTSSDNIQSNESDPYNDDYDINHSENDNRDNSSYVFNPLNNASTLNNTYLNNTNYSNSTNKYSNSGSNNANLNTEPFYHESFQHKDIKQLMVAINTINAIPDEMFYYVLGDAYNELWKMGISFDCEKYQNLAQILIDRKKALLELLPNLSQIDVLLEKLQNTQEDFTQEDVELLNELSLLVYKNTILNTVINMRDVDLIANLLNYEIDVHRREIATNGTPLVALIRLGKIDLAYALIDKGADIEGKNSWGATPLVEAVMMGDLDATKFLVSLGANVYYRNLNSDENLLHYAVMRGNVDLIKYLICQGLDMHHKNKYNKSPFDYAILMGNQDIIQFLMSFSQSKFVNATAFDQCPVDSE